MVWARLDVLDPLAGTKGGGRHWASSLQVSGLAVLTTRPDSSWSKTPEKSLHSPKSAQWVISYAPPKFGGKQAGRQLEAGPATPPRPCHHLPHGCHTSRGWVGTWLRRGGSRLVGVDEIKPPGTHQPACLPVLQAASCKGCQGPSRTCKPWLPRVQHLKGVPRMGKQGW
jgi:hypothetical protein